MRANPIGWVIGGFFTIGGAAFAIFPATRLLGLIWVGVSLVLFGFFAVLGGRARAREQLWSTGVRGTAVIRDIQETGTRINDQPLLAFTLEVSAPGIAPYELSKRDVVPWVGLDQLGAGRELAVAIDPRDHSSVAIDWRGFASAIPPTAPVASSLAAPAPQTGGDGAGASADAIAAKLRRIDELRDPGVISEAERDRLRGEALRNL